jgi:transcriptional regulator with PAS, ATPase and Fis domain
MIGTGEFREDFYYRISTFALEIPPLRERKEDIVQMVHFFISKLSNDMKKTVTGIDDELMTFLKHYDYPGNIRELKNMIERLIVLSSDGMLRKDDLFLSTPKKVNQNFHSLKEFRNIQEKTYIESVLKANDHHLTKTAEVLGITRRQLFNKIQELEIEVEK